MRFLRRALLGLVTAAGGCVADNDLSLFILHNQVPEEGCIVPAQDTGLYRSIGTLDVRAPNPGYLFTPVVQNGTAVDPDNPNQNVVILQGADISLVAGTTSTSIELLDGLGGAPLLREEQQRRTMLFSGSVAPGGTTGVGFLALDADQVNELRAAMDSKGWTSVQIVARISIFGEIDGGGLVETPPFDYPITVCIGCLVRDLGACSSVPPGTQIRTGNSCNPYQDTPVDCCTSNGALLCPAPVSSGG